jgi:ribonucleoside-triphosphate reductase
MNMETIAIFPQEVINRDNKKIPFRREKIQNAIKKAGEETGEFGMETARKLTASVIKVLMYRHNGAIPHIEQIQDVVEQVLIEEDFFLTARAYIAYREQHKRLRADRSVVDVESSVNEYLKRTDWRVNANANQGYSLGGLILNISGKVTANYWLHHVYTPDIGEAHRQGDIHIHDLDMLSGYCAGWSLRTLLHEGFNGVPGRIDANPPRHLTSAIGQMVNFLGTLQNEWAGAQAFSSFDTYLAPYVRKDNLSFKEVKQSIQEFVYNLNVPSRWGSQTPFTNITMDWVCPEDLREQIPVIGGEEQPYAYGDLKKEMEMINRAYLEVMTEGDATGRVFTFPIPTYNITEDFDWDSENADLLFEMTSKYGLPYFQNFLNSELNPSMVRSMCCRLQLDLRELLARGNGLFGSAEQTGSLGVVTVNCARLGYLYRADEKGLFERLDQLLSIAKRSLEVKRKMIQGFMDQGLFPYTKRYLGTLKNHFSTIGVNGINEMIRNFTGDRDDISTEFGQTFALKFLTHIREQMKTFQEETGNLYNLEATPAEGTTYRFAKEDQRRYDGIIQSGTEERPYYTNSSQLPVGFTDDPFEALDKQEKLQSQYTGGTVLHLYMSERISTVEACKKLVRRSLENYRLPYLTVTPTFSICPDHGYLNGEQPICPECGSKTEVWTRVMGYHRPVSEFNAGKVSEYEDRILFKEQRAVEQLEIREQTGSLRAIANTK